MKRTHGRTEKARRFIIGVTLFLALAVLLYNAVFGISYSYETNWKNVTIDTAVNITESLPSIRSVTVDSPITLNAGTSTIVYCNASIRDYNGGNTITNVSAVFYDNNSVGPGDSDDNNTHYTQSNCTNVSVNNYYANFSCNFTVMYYANNGTNWVCNVTVTDDYSFNESVNNTDDAYNTSTLNALYALNVSTQLLDYGNMAVGDTSSSHELNITNYGNMNVNISVKGYGQSENDGLSFYCDVGNISIGSERYSLTQADTWNVMTALTNSFVNISNLMLPQQTNDSAQVINQTYWRLYVPPNPFGQCNGTITFQAEDATA